MRRIVVSGLRGAVIFTVILSFFFFGAAGASELALMATLEMPTAKFGAEGGIAVKYNLTNASDKPVTVLKWNTPLEGFMNDIFKIIHDGESILYVGPMIKRAPPTPDDYVEIGPGETVSDEIDLNEAYAIYQKGSYNVRLRYDLFDAGLEAPPKMAAYKVRMPLVIPANAVTFELTEERPQLKALMEEPAAAPGNAPVFRNCSQERQDILSRALSSAVFLSDVADATLRNTPMDACPNARRYVTWFGSYTEDRYDTVHEHFDKILDALENKTITFDCGCTSSAYAYVYPNKPYIIYLCNAFWTAPMTGTDSKAGTVIHETSHFYVVAGTKDHAYGQANCKKLAENKPQEAVNNADSHEYYAEDTPPIPMP